MNNSRNFSKLNKYFLYIYNNKKEMKNITKISLETGISTSTISRYAVKSGFYSFPAMRAHFNERLEISKNYVTRDKKIFEGIINSEKVFILSSKSSQLAARFLNDRLNYMDINSKFIDFNIPIDDFLKHEKNTDMKIIFITLTGESLRLKKLHSLFQDDLIIITTIKKSGFINKNKQIILRNYKPLSNSHFDKNNSIIKIINWINEIINIIYIEKNK